MVEQGPRLKVALMVVEQGPRLKVALMVVEQGPRLKVALMVVEQGLRLKVALMVVEQGSRLKVAPMVVEQGPRLKVALMVVEQGPRSMESSSVAGLCIGCLDIVMGGPRESSHILAFIKVAGLQQCLHVTKWALKVTRPIIEHVACHTTINVHTYLSGCSATLYGSQDRDSDIECLGEILIVQLNKTETTKHVTR